MSDSYRAGFSWAIVPPYMLSFVEWVSHWHQNVYNIRKMLILALSEVGSNEILGSGHCPLTGI
jgi:hypothetical protein